MKAHQRRNEILSLLGNASLPIPAGILSEKFAVSRQVIVQDIAVLRAEGYDVISTNRGYLLGGGRQDGLYVFGRRMAALTGLVLVAPSLLLWLLRTPAAGLFSSETAVLEQASLFLCFACLSGPVVGMTGMLNALFSGAGATILSCRVGAVTCWVVGIPLALLLGPVLNMGAAGVYAAGLAGQVAALLWTIRLFRGKKWLEYGLRKRHTA